MSKLLNIKLTKKVWGGQSVLMAGFPLMHLNKYLKILVQDGNRFVALCEEFPRDPALGARGGFDRRVVRIVTPGTLIDEPFLNPYENNFLLSVASASTENADAEVESDQLMGLAWIDVSTGEFYTKRISAAALRDELVRINPREVVLDERSDHDEAPSIRKMIVEEGYLVSGTACSDETHLPLTSNTTDPDDITSHEDVSTHAPLPAQLHDAESQAVKLLTAFMRTNLLEHMPHLSSPNTESSSSRMQIDAHTAKALELRESIREGGTAGSLFNVIKRTVTTGGTRLLARWLGE